jgi:NAD-dependent dihydropyrimidine dehydrogenase PreA subunit
MAHVIVDTCRKNYQCIDVCPTDCIHPKKGEAKAEEAAQLYIDPKECRDCGACVMACPTDSIFPLKQLPEDKADFAEKNAAFFNPISH